LQNQLYFTVDSEAELEKKWPSILALRPDFLKTNLWYSDEFEKRKDDAAYVGRKALDPRLLPSIVSKAHASGLRVSAHVTNAADFHNALAAGVDEIVHVPGTGMFNALEERVYELTRNPPEPGLIEQVVKELHNSKTGSPSYIPVSREDAQLAARRGIVVITTVGLVARSPESLRRLVEPAQSAMLKLLHENGVALAVGSDNVIDTSVQEAANLQGRGIFDNVTLLRMWTETTARAFIALEGNPIDDWRNVSKIKVRFKQGVVLPP
jgi:imidazolonepropionase-like amidohydrolase